MVEVPVVTEIPTIKFAAVLEKLFLMFATVLLVTVFTTPEFYANMDYLIWYQGKDFAKRITQKLPQFQIERYYNFAKKHFDYTQFPDLVELKTLIETVANS